VAANKFRSLTNNSRLTKSLFLEESYMDRSSVLYTLKDVDHDGYPSLYRKYLAMEDPTEIEFARVYLDGWEHWDNICQTQWFKPYITRWRLELDLQIKAKALKRVMEIANDGESKESFQASKFLLSGLWKDKTEGKVGRPSKEAIKREAESLFEAERQTSEDLLRITN